MLVYAFLVETICVTYALYAPSLAGYTSVVYTFSGLTIGIGLLWASHTASEQLSFFSFKKPTTRYKWLLMGIILIAMYYFSKIWIEDAPLNYQQADMLPIIKTMCERATTGHWSIVYEPIPEIWGGIPPIYLPAMWLPFCLPVLLHIDIRWLTLLVLFISFCTCLWRINPFHQQAFPVLLSSFLLCWWLLTDDKSGLIPYTEEGIVLLYYVLLVLSLYKRKAWLIAICLSLCVLSRYALIGWLPAMIIYYSYQKNWKQLIQFVLTGAGCFILLALLPLGWNTFSRLIVLPSAYIDFAARVWHDAPHVFRESLGWAKFFGIQRIALLHYLLVSLSFIVPVAFVLITLALHKKYRFSIENIPLAALKITLVVFYTFIDVPYLYLFYTSSFVSLVAMSYLVKYKSAKEPSTQ